MKKYVITIVVDEDHVGDSLAELSSEIDGGEYYDEEGNLEICGLEMSHCEVTDCYTEEYD